MTQHRRTRTFRVRAPIAASGKKPPRMERTMNSPADVVAFLTSSHCSLATAESCTGGLIASTLAAVPGSGACLDVGFVAYSPSGKAGFLGVRPETIEQFGLTSEEVAREMAEGALTCVGCSANVAVSNTGVADAGGDGSVPPGTQCFAWSWRTGNGELRTFSETVRFAGDRDEVRHAAALYALSRLPDYLRASRYEDSGDAP